MQLNHSTYSIPKTPFYDITLFEIIMNLIIIGYNHNAGTKLEKSECSGS